MGYELLILKSHSRKELQVMHTGPCTAQELKLLSTQRIYIRPIQREIPLLQTGPPANHSLLPCHCCGQLYLTSELREHAEGCTVCIN